MCAFAGTHVGVGRGSELRRENCFLGRFLVCVLYMVETYATNGRNVCIQPYVHTVHTHAVDTHLYMYKYVHM